MQYCFPSDVRCELSDRDGPSAYAEYSTRFYVWFICLYGEILCHSKSPLKNNYFDIWAILNMLNLLYTGGICHCYMLDESIFHFRGVGSILSLFYFWWKITLANNVDPEQTLHPVASDLDLYCLPMILLRVSRSEMLNKTDHNIITHARRIC